MTADLTNSARAGAAGADFLAGGGAMGALIRDHDWASTPLGPIKAWPQSLKAAIGTILRSPVPIVTLWGEEGVMIYNDAYSEFAGGRHPRLLGSNVREGWPEVADFNDNVMKVGLAGGTLSYKDQELTLYRHGEPEQVWMNLDYSPLLDESGQPAGVIAVVVETTERKHAERLRIVQNRVLELAIEDTSLKETLRALVEAVESQSTARVLGSVLLLDEDGVHLRHGAAPGLPDAYNQAIDGTAIGPSVGSCGTAAHERQPVHVSDIATDPRWADFRDLALSHGLRACWSTPILSGQGAVLGTFAMYYDEPREANPADMELVEFVTRSASLVIERKKAEQALREESRTLETLNRTAADLGAELDLQRLVQKVTDAGVELTGAQIGAFFYNVLNEAGESYMLYALSGVDRSAFDKFPMPRNTAVFGPTFRGEGVVRSDDITRDARYGRNTPNKGMPEGHLPVRSYLAVPVVSRSGEVIGGLFFGHAEPGRFTDRHERLMTGIAAHAAIGIDNARLYQAAQNEIADRKRIEDALRQSQERLALIFDKVEVGICETGLDGRFRRVNPAFADIVGYSRKELADASYADLTHPDDRERDVGALAKMKSGDMKVYRAEKRYIRGDGETVWVTLQSTLVHNESGEPLYAVTTMQDITDRKRAEQELRESEERLRIVQTAGGIGSFDYDLQKDDAVCSPEYYAMFGLPDGHPINRETWPAAIHPDDRAKAMKALDRAIAERKPFDYEYRIVRADNGEVRWLTGRAAIVFDAEDRPWRYVGGNIDVTQRRAAEEAVRELNETLEARVAQAVAEREQAQEQLRQAQKMEAVGQLTGGVAHDFNNLLTVVIGNIDMGRRALDAAGGDARTRRALDNALRGAERAAALTERLLAFARRQPLEPKPIEVDKLVRGMSDLLARSLGETIALEIVSSPGLWRVEADPNQLEAAILNLAVNARDAMADGGELTIETANARIDEAYTATHAEVAPGHYAVIAVTDTGTGMSKDMASRVFEPFFTTKEVGKGTGLGLSQVYGFVKQSGGHVKIYSEEGEGTTVKIYLPRLLAEAEAEEMPAPAAAVERSPAEETLLVVEDDDDVRGYTVELLREIGYRVLEAHDGPSALSLLDRQETPINLLFTDVVMPGMSGRELADAARERQPHLRILYTSGYARDAIVHGGRLDPGVDLIVKPFTYQALARKVRDMLDTGRSGRLLIVENGGEGSALADALDESGYQADITPRASEALGKVRANGSFYDMVVIDVASTDKAGRTLATQLRGLHIDLPLLLRAPDAEIAELSERFSDDRCTAVIRHGAEAEECLDALRRLGMRCEGGGSRE